jgi:hypothetical protein
MRRWEAIEADFMSNRAAITQYLYRGPFGEVSQSGRNFFAWQNGHLIGTYRTFEKAMEHLAWKERLKTDEDSRLSGASGISPRWTVP